MSTQTYDYVVIGSGFGGSVSALRLAEKGYRVLVLERGKRYRAADFPRTNWNLTRFLWLPPLRCFGIMGLNLFKDIVVLNGSGLGGGSLVYAGVMRRPDRSFFRSPAWRDLADWEHELTPCYDLAEEMMGVAPNPWLGPADDICRDIAIALGREASFQPAPVSVYFGEPGVTVPDPYFGGAGPARSGCTFCGNCMVGCRFNGKNSLDKNYLYLAEQAGVEIRAEAEAQLIRPLRGARPGGARYEVTYRQSTAWLDRRPQRVRARNVVVAAGVLGTLELLFRCRDGVRTLPGLSPQLGQTVRSNGEALLGITTRHALYDFSQGVAITSSFQIDEQTSVEPVRYARGSSVMRHTALPLASYDGSPRRRLGQLARHIRRHPRDFLKVRFLPDWARDTTILLVMQTAENRMRFTPGRALFGARLASERDQDYPIPAVVEAARPALQQFAERVDGIPQAMFNEALLNTPSTAHILGGCIIGRDPGQGVIDTNHEVFNYPGLYVIDASTIPANLGVNPSLTVLALAERAMQRIPPANGGRSPVARPAAGEGAAGAISLVNPATGRPFGAVRGASPADVERALGELRQAFPAWRQLPIAQRVSAVKQLQAAIVRRLDELTAVISQDVGKSRQEAMIELLMTVDKLQQYGRHAPRWLRRRRVPPGLYPFKRYFTIPRPYGVVALLTPYNYPFDLCVPAICAALLAGNTVLAKPSDIAAGTGAIIAELFREIPQLAPYVRVLAGGRELGEAIVAARPDLIFLTGSTETGRRVARAAGETLTPLLLELSGKDPMIVLEDADIEAAARWGAWGAFLNAGQTCMGIERVYVADPVYDSFLSALVARTRELRLGYNIAVDAPYQVGPLADSRQLALVEAHLQDALQKGARVLVGGRRHGHFFEPTVLVDVRHEMRLMREETFGPLLPVMRVRDEEEAIHLANDSDLGLSASVWSRDLERAQRVAERLEVGSVNINDVISHFAVAQLPFGGVKQSGNARTHGERDVLQFTHCFALAVGRPPLPFDLATRMRLPGHYHLGKAVVQLMFGVGWRQRLDALSSLMKR